MKLYYHELHTISSRNLSIQNSSFKSSEKFFIIKHLIEEKRHFKCCVMLYFEFTKKIHSDFDPCFVYKNCSINLKKMLICYQKYACISFNLVR